MLPGVQAGKTGAEARAGSGSRGLTRGHSEGHISEALRLTRDPRSQCSPHVSFLIFSFRAEVFDLEIPCSCGKEGRYSLLPQRKSCEVMKA